jgi:hypothetical protein
MKYINNLVENCRLAMLAKPIKIFTFTEMDDLNYITNAIYIIEEVGGDINCTHNDFAEYRKSTDRKCSKINKKPSTVLYVGSSTTGVKKRIEQHLGNGHKGTYALNLKHWFPPRKEKITILEYDVSPEILQIIEDATSYDLSPAFGKSGDNGK